MIVGFNDSDISKEITIIYDYLEDLFKNPYEKKHLKIKKIRDDTEYIVNRCLITIFINMMSYVIGYTYEKTKHYSDEIINDVMSDLPFWNTIKCKTNLSPSEMFQQFRNCFEHANYLLLVNGGQDENNTKYKNIVDIGVDLKDINGKPIDESDDLYVYFSNNKIEGIINLNEYIKLYNKCADLLSKYDVDENASLLSYTAELKINRIRNSRDLELFMNKCNITNMTASINPNSTEVIIVDDSTALGDLAHYGLYKKQYNWGGSTTINNPFFQDDAIQNFIKNKIGLGMNQINIVSRKMSSHEKEKMRNYVKYITNNFSRSLFLTNDFSSQCILNNKLCHKTKNVLGYIFSEIDSDKTSSFSLYDIQKKMLSDKLLNASLDDLIAVSPGLYLMTIISSTHYFLNYLYETNQKMDREIFKYSEVDLNEIVIENKTTDKLVKTTDPLFKEKEELASTRKQLKELFDKLKWSKNQILILNNPKNNDPNKYAKLESIKEFINNYDARKKELEDKEQMLSDFIDSNTHKLPYMDSYHLFRHLRNSIAHGRFIVNFDNGYIAGDIGKSEIVFYDIDDGANDDIKNANVIIKMKLDRFRKLSKNLSSIVCNQAKDGHYSEISKRIVSKP